MIFFFCKEMISGSSKIYWSYSWFYIGFHFFIQASFIVDTEGWYCVTNGNISFSSFRSLNYLLWILFLIVGFLSKIVGSLRWSSVFFLIWIILLKVVSEEFFNIWRVTWGKMCVQEGFHLFKMYLCIKDRFFLESCAFVSVSYTHLTLPTKRMCRSRWSPYH